ncbi:MAG TPA: Fic family protein [Candidatus Ornithomonoglobus intestinigallinarum]|uniref:protein adenylyltransferase n=1 Tax=Candidatus Ornithomonoglobus intestinigallinarum TaxID=2840894 RepID=A0A9D1KQT0_9FIRM|nr:Fic family protein [Candidatus Ornithomonoglobus intestinigallinarum]
MLINKFGIKDNSKLDMVERDITSALIAKAYINIPFKGVDFDFYKNLHRYVFSDIYEWAGSIRNVAMSKKGTRFCPPEKIEMNGTAIFEYLSKKSYFENFTGEEFVKELTELYCRLNYLHPFREGNGRIQRLFLSMLLKNIGKIIDFSKIDADLLMIATIKAVSGDVFMLYDIFNHHIRQLNI